MRTSYLVSRFTNLFSILDTAESYSEPLQDAISLSRSRRPSSDIATINCAPDDCASDIELHRPQNPCAKSHFRGLRVECFNLDRLVVLPGKASLPAGPAGAHRDEAVGVVLQWTMIGAVAIWLRGHYTGP